MDDTVAELRAQLQQQVDGLVELEQALAFSPDDAELLELKEQLEEGIVHLMESLQELQQGQEEVQQQHQQQQQQQHQQPPAWLLPGACCLFRHTDSLLHPGVVHAWQPQQQEVVVGFAFPRLPFQLQLVQLPLGLVLPSTASEPAHALSVGSRVLALLPGEQLWQPAEVIRQQQGQGAARWTVQVVGQQRITTLAAAHLVPLEQAAAVAADRLDAAAGEPSGRDSDMSISGASGGSSSCNDSDDDAGEDSHAGLGCVMQHARLAAAAGASTETVMFAAWERSSRGISSKIMANMGFKAGSGLGRQGQGIAAPLDIDVQASRKGLGCAPPKRSGHHHHHHGQHGSSSNPASAAAAGGKQKLTGRRRKRAKAAADRRAASAGDRQRQSAMEAVTGEVGLFAFINTSLGHGSEAAAKLAAAGVYGNEGSTRQTAGGAALAAAAAAAAGQAPGVSAGRGNSSSKQQQKPAAAQKERAGLVGSQDDVSGAKARVAHLSAMLERNKGDKGLATQIKGKLTQAKHELQAAAAKHSQLHKAAADKAAVTKWAKF